MAKREGGAYFWWVFGPLWAAMILAAFIPACTEMARPRPREHWLLRVTTTGGIVLNEAQGERCSVGSSWAYVEGADNKITYEVTNKSANVILSCTKLP